MINKIIKMYEAQYSLYNKIFDVLNNASDKQNAEYVVLFDKVKNKLEKIDILNKELDLAKRDYIKTKKITNFIGEEIAKVEEKDKYLEFKKVIDKLCEKIKLTKKLQDNFVACLNKQTFEVSKTSNDNLKIYKERMKDKENLHKITYLDKTK